MTHFLLAPDEDGTPMTIAFGQGASNGRHHVTCETRDPTHLYHHGLAGELGLGVDEPKSATKPTKMQPLLGIEVIQCVPYLPVSRALVVC